AVVHVGRRGAQAAQRRRAPFAPVAMLENDGAGLHRARAPGRGTALVVEGPEQVVAASRHAPDAGVTAGVDAARLDHERPADVVELAVAERRTDVAGAAV